MKRKFITVLSPLGALFCVLVMASQPTYAILNGDPVGPNTFPYFAGVGGKDAHPQFTECGGVLIHPEWVLTAGHCLRPKHTNQSIPIGYYHANENGNWTKQMNARPQIEGQIKFWSYKIRSSTDIALIKLAEPVWGAENRLELATDVPKNGTIANIIGGGYHVKNNAARDRVRASTTPIQSHSAYGIEAGGINNLGIETGGCHHDSGGPLVFQKKVLGIQSSSSVCLNSSTSNYVNVTSAKAKNWIHCTVPLDPTRTTVVEGQVDFQSLGIPHTQSVDSTVEIMTQGGTETPDGLNRICKTSLDENGFYRAYLPANANTGFYEIEMAVLKEGSRYEETNFVKASNQVWLEKGMVNTIQTQTSQNQKLRISSTNDGHINNYGGQDPYKNWTPELGEVIQGERWDEGGEGIAYHERDNTRQGHTDYRPGSGVDSKRFVVGWFHPDEWLEYTVSIPKHLQGVPGSMRMNAAAGCGHGKSITMLIESNAMSLPLKMSVPYTGGWSNYNTVESETTLAFKGDTAIIRVKNATPGGGCAGINLDWFQFVPSR